MEIGTTMFSWITKFAAMTFRFFKGIRTPSLSGYLDEPVSYSGKKLYPVYLTFHPGSSRFVYQRIRCNCPMYLPTEPYWPDPIIVVGGGETRYYPGKKAPDPYLKTITLRRDGGDYYLLFFVDAEGKDFIKFTIDEGKRHCFQIELTWCESVA